MTKKDLEKEVLRLSDDVDDLCDEIGDLENSLRDSEPKAVMYDAMASKLLAYTSFVYGMAATGNTQALKLFSLFEKSDEEEWDEEYEDVWGDLDY